MATEKSDLNFQDALLASDMDRAAAIMDDYLADKTPFEFIDEVVVNALDRIGNGWHKGEYALSQVYMSGRISEDLLEKVLPDESNLRKVRPKMAIALLNDYHALGKRMVYAVLRAGGYELIDYGRVDAEELIGRVKVDKIEVIMISVLMLTSALKIKDIVKSLKQGSNKVSIIVGGAPFRIDQTLWQEVGADAVGYTASDALQIVKRLEGGLK